MFPAAREEQSIISERGVREALTRAAMNSEELLQSLLAPGYADRRITDQFRAVLDGLVATKKVYLREDGRYTVHVDWIKYTALLAFADALQSIAATSENVAVMLGEGFARMNEEGDTNNDDEDQR